MTKFLKNADVTGYISQTSVTSSLVKTDVDGKLVAAIAGTDYNAPGVSASAGTLIREIRNTTGATLTKGTIVYISGATGNKPTVSKALATGDSTSAQTFGMCQTDIPNNSNGNVVCFGDLSGLNTSAFTEGAQLYLSSTTAGEYTTTKQLAPAHLVYIGVVTRAHPTLGQIEVRIQNGYELDEIHDVAISSLANNQGLFYESATDLWKNKTIATVLGYTPADDAAVVKLTGNQTVAGVKTFTASLLANNPSEGATGEGLIAGQSFKIDGTGTGQRAIMYVVSRTLSDTYASGLTAQYSNFAGDKAFGFNLNTAGGFELYVKNTSFGKALAIANTMAATFGDSVTATSFIKTSGTSAQFLKADGSVDSSTYLTSYTETDTLATVTGRGATTSTPIIVTASEGREVAVYMASSYTTNDLVSGHEYGWYSDHWRLGMTRSGASAGADFVIQWNAARRLSLTNDGNLTVTGTIGASNLSGTNTGDQTNISGNAATVTSITSTQVTTALGYTPYNSTNPSGYITNAGASSRLSSRDNRTISPSEDNAAELRFGFTSWANNDGAPYADYLHLRSYSDNSGGADNLVMFLKSGIGMRIWQQTYGSATAYSSYVDVLHSSNYNSYALPLSGGTLTGNVVASGDTYTTYGPNSNWTSYLRVGGNGRTVTGNAYASVVTTNGNLHLDSGDARITYINYYAGTGGIALGNGASGVVASMDSTGNLWKGGTIGAGTQYVFNSGTWAISISGTANTATTATNWGTYGSVPAAGTSFANANTIGRSDANGYTFFNFINSNTDNNENPTVSQVIVTNGSDNYYRKASIAHLMAAVRSSASGTWSITTTGNVASRGQSGWNDSTVINNVVGMLAWKNYGNGHVIFDASNGTSPSGTGVSTTNPTVGWTATYPTLMGWNGDTTFGVRVDSARTSDLVEHRSSRTDSAWYNIIWGAGNPSHMYSADTVQIQSSTGAIRANIYYDNQDTTYYLDPNSTTSAIFRGSVGLNNTSPINTAWGNATTTTQLSIYGSLYGVLNIRGDDGGARTFSMGVGNNTFYMCYDNTAARHNLTVNSSGNVLAAVDFRAPIFYDSDNPAYYLNPSSESNLYRFTISTMTRNAMNYFSINSPFITRSDQARAYQTGIMGWGTVDFNHIFSNWGSGFIDTWSMPGNRPNDSSTHWIGLQSMHYAFENNSQGYGFQMACPGEVANRYFWRNGWPNLNGWVEMVHTGNIASQVASNTSGNTNSISSAVGGSYSWTGVQYFKSNLGGYCGSLANPVLQANSDSNNSAFLSFHKGGHYAVNMGLDADNVLRIGGWSAAANRWQLDMSGNQTIAGASYATSFFESSDATIKTLITDNYQAKGIESVIAKLYIKEGKEELGYYAQDVQDILPSAVSKGMDGLLSLSYREVHTAKIARLEKEVEELKSQLARL